MGGSEAGSPLQTELRARGFRLTPQRQLVLQAVGQLGHATPEQVLVAVQRTASGVNASTVYRTLSLLEELGLVRHTHLGHGAPAFSLAGDEECVHVVCRGCGAVQELPVGLLDDVAKRLSQRGFALDAGHAALFGRCAACAAAQG